MDSWPILSLDSIKSELDNVECIDNYSLIHEHHDQGNDQIQDESKKNIEEFLSLYKQIIVYEQGNLQLQYKFYSDYFILLQKLLKINELDISEEDKTKYKAEYDKLNDFITHHSIHFDSLNETLQKDLNVYIKQIKNCETKEDYIQLFDAYESYPPIIVSTKRVPFYEDIQYPTYKQILKDILRDTFALNNDEIKGSYGYQFISQKIMNQIACILGQLYDNTTFSLDINELNALLSIDYKAKDFESAIQKPSLLASNTISESMIDLNYLFYKVFHLLSRSYSGEILYKALEAFYPVQSAYHYAPGSSKVLPITIEMKLCFDYDEQQQPFLAFQTTITVKACYTFKHSQNDSESLQHNVLLSYTIDLIQGLYEHKQEHKEQEYVSISVISE